MDLLKRGLFCTKCLTVLIPLFLVINSPVTKGQCSLDADITNSEYMWWTETDEFQQELVMTFTDSQTCKRYVNNNAVTPSGYTAKSCEDCVSSTATSNNGVRYVGEQVAPQSPSLRLIICNELFPSTLGNVMIHRDELRDQRVPGSVTASECQIETSAAKWLIRTQPGDLTLKQTATCPFVDGSYRVVYGYNGNNRCLGGTNQIATVRISGSQMTFDASQCEDYVTDRAARGYVSTDTTKDYTLPLYTTLVCATGTEFPQSILGRSDTGNLLLLADLDPPANLNLKRPWYYAANYEIVGTDEILISISTQRSTPDEILIDPAQAPRRISNTLSSVLYLTLIKQNLIAECTFPSAFEQTWFVQYTTSGADAVEMMYDEMLNSAVNRRIYKGKSDKPTLTEQICTEQQTSTVGSSSSSGTFYFLAMGEVPGELTCYAYMAPNSAVTDKVLVGYETTRGIITIANQNTCRDYMNTYNAATDANKQIKLRVQPRIWLDNYDNGIFGSGSLFGNWDDSYKCPLGEGAYQAVYSESSSIFNQCSGNKESYIIVSGNGITINTCADAADSTYQKPYHAVLTCIANWNAETTPHLPPGQGQADEYTSDHYLVLAYKDLKVGTGVMRFYCARYRIENGGNTVFLALNVDSETQTLCRTDLNAEAYVSSTGTTAGTSAGNIRQFTMSKFSGGVCEASPCQNDGTCNAIGSTGDFSCSCHSSYSGGLCQFRAESFSEDDVTTTIVIVIVVCLVLVAIIILAVILRERQVRSDEKKRMDTEYGRSEGQKPDNISTISGDPKSNVSMNGSNVQAWFPDYRTAEK